MLSESSRELKKRQLRGEPFATHVIDWLNGKERDYWGPNGPESRKRILDLIDCIRKTLTTIEREPHRDLINHASLELANLMRELDRRIAEYQSVPTFYISHGKEWVF